jgi:hypothetical protein
VLKIRIVAISGGPFLGAARWKLLDVCGESQRQSFSDGNDTRIVHILETVVFPKDLSILLTQASRKKLYMLWRTDPGKLPRNHQISHKRTIHRKCTNEDMGLTDRQVGLRRIVMIHKSKL